MGKWGFLLFISFFYSGAMAAPGFYSPSAPDAPEVVKKAAPAVYRYVYFLKEPRIFKADQYEALLNDINPSFYNRIRAQVVRKCKSENKPTCELFVGGWGTAFVVGPQRDRLLTARHNATNDINEFEKALSKGEFQRLAIHVGNDKLTLSRHIPLCFLLLDADGKVAFDTRQGDFAYPEVLGATELMTNWRDSYYFGAVWESSVADFMSVRLSRSVGKHYLELREEPVKEGEKIYNIGFPSATWDRVPLEKVPNSNGMDMYYSSGSISSPRKALEYMVGPDFIRYPDEYLKAYNAYYTHLSFADAESEMGQSGGPVLDTSGKVIGIVVGQVNRELDLSQRVYHPFNHVSLNSDWLLKQLRRYKP